MANPYAQFVQPEASDNPYLAYSSSPVADQTEQDIINRTNDPAQKTPPSFGFAQIPKDFAAAFTSDIISTPGELIGGNLVESGDLSAGMKGKSTLDVMKQSFAKRMNEAALAQQNPTFMDKWTPDIFKSVAMLYGIEKDALLSMISDGDAPAAIANAGHALIEKNQDLVAKFGLTPPDQPSIAWDLGAGSSQLFKQMGLWWATKSPTAGAVLMGATVNSQAYEEVKNADIKAGKPYDPERWAQIAGADAGVQGLLEGIGTKLFVGAFKASTMVRKVLFGGAEQAFEEGSQGAAEEAILGVTGIRNTPLADKVKSIGYQAALGFVLGAPVSGVLGAIHDSGEKEGLPQDKINELADYLVKKKDEIIDAGAELINRETAGVTNDAPAQKEAVQAVKQVLAQDKPPEEGQATSAKKEQKISPVTKQTASDIANVKTESDANVANALPTITAENTDAAVMKGRIDKLDTDIASHDKRIDQLLSTIDEREAQGKTNAANNKKLDKLLAEREAMDGERADLLTTERPIETHKRALQAGQEKIQVKGDTLSKGAKRSAQAQQLALNNGFRKGIQIAKKNVKLAQRFVTNLINESGLALQDKGKFLVAIKNVQTAEQLPTAIRKIQSRIMNLMDAQQRREIIDRIRNTVAKVKKSNAIAVDFANQIEDLVNEIDTSKRTASTLDSLQKTLAFMKKNPDAKMPKRVLQKLEILNKKPLEDITTAELSSLNDAIDSLVQQGKTKLALMESQKERLKQDRITELQKESVPLSDTNTKRATIGERLSVMDRIKNKYIEFKNRSKRIGLALNPMDVFFDMLDGGKSYRGANHRIFKQTVDKAFSRYLNLKEDASRAVKNLADKLELTEQNFEKIGVWAALQQEGGKKKLLETGITQDELDNLKLDGNETKMYQLMREKLDGMLPQIKEIMRTVYNKNVDDVKDYFPFMTDHEAMKDFEIQDQIGDNVPQVDNKKNVEKGFTKDRTLGKQKIRIDALGVFLKHIDNAAYLVEMGGDIKALGDVASNSEYEKAVGDIGQEMVVEWVNLLARKGNLPGRIALVDALRRNVGFATLGFKLSSLLIQPTSLADGAALVGSSYVVDGALKVGTSPEWRKFLWENFPEIRERVGDDAAYLDMGGNGIVGKVREAGFWALKKLDALSASAVAIGAYTKSVEQRGGEVDFSNPDPAAIQEAQLMMRRTQSSAFAKDSPAIITQGELTGNVSIDKLLFQFQSFMLNRWSLIKHDMWALGVKGGNTKQALNITIWMILATAAEIGVRRLSKELIAALIGDDTEPWEKTITKESISTALGNIPFVSQAISSFEYGSIPVPALSAISAITDEMKLAAQSKSSEKKAKHLTSAALLGLGVIFGVPGSTQAENVIKKATK